MQVVVGIRPFGPCPADALFCVRHIGPRLINRCHPSGYVRFHALDVGLRYRNPAYQGRDSSALVRDLSFKSRLRTLSCDFISRPELPTAFSAAELARGLQTLRPTLSW